MILTQISEILSKGDQNQIVELVRQAFDEGVTPEMVLNEGLIAGMDRVGQKFQAGEI